MLDELCICSHPQIDHAHAITPWWQFWTNAYEYEFEGCYNKECREAVQVMSYNFVTFAKCPKFQLDNLTYIEQLARKRKLV